MRSVAPLALVLALLVLGASPARATTWGEVQVACPLCAHENTFEEPMSSGSYIYRWPSRFQVLFWPVTEGRSVWSCAGCRLTCFMWDFREKVEPEHHERLRAALADVTLTAVEGGYLKLPILERLAAAEKVYEVIGSDADARCRFYRVVGYHAAKAGQTERAVAARRRALELVLARLEDPEAAGMAKQNRVIAAGLLRLLGDGEGALVHLDAAAPLAITLEDPARAKNATEYLDELIAALREKLAAGDLSDDAPEAGGGH